MILFGWNHYLLRKIHPHELGIIDQEHANMTFEYRQKYFHLFFIPFFPIGRFWGVKKEGKLFHMAPELENALKQMPATGKNGVWAWSGLLLIGVAMIIFNISSSIEQKAFSSRMQANAAELSSFFQDKSKIDPLFKKMEAINYIIDSAMEKDDFENKKIDTSQSNLMRLYAEIIVTQADSLKGYSRDNTFITSHFHNGMKSPKVLSEQYENALTKGKWEGYSGDTSNVFREMRNLENYRYVLVLKEYNRVDPEVYDNSFNSGYSFMNATIIEIATGRTIKKFRVLGINSEQVSSFGYGESKTAPSEWKRKLQQDLDRNTVKEATEYVFGKESVKYF